MAVRNLFCNFFPSSFRRGKREFGIRANDFDDFGYTGDVVYFISVNYFILVLMFGLLVFVANVHWFGRAIDFIPCSISLYSV